MHPEDGGRYGGARADVAARVGRALAWPPVQVVAGDVCGVEPRDVARWLVLEAHKDRSGGFNAQHVGSPGNRRPADIGLVAERCDDELPWPPTVVASADVATVEPGTLPEGAVCYMDPPYSGTTGYQAKLPREKVLEVAQRWADAGATVCVSEAEPLPLPGWHHVEITECRVGQRRTFSKQKREWLTLNRAPAWVPGVQGRLL